MLLTTAGGRALGWQYWVCESLAESSRAGLGCTSGRELEENSLELEHWEVMTDVGPFAGTELQVTALTFSSPSFPRNKKFTCSHIGTIFYC